MANENVNARGQRGQGGGERRGRDDRRGGRDNPREEKSQYLERVVAINRVAKVVQGEKAAGVVLLRPASPGTGVIAGGSARAVLECAGISDVLAKSLGSANAINVVHATVTALQQLEEPEQVAKRRGLPVEDVAPAALLRARKEGAA